MRKIARTNRATDGVQRVMIHETANGTYLFLYQVLDDGPGAFDEWYVTTSEAESACEMRYGITDKAWKVIDDPQEGWQQDWIGPVRVKGRDIGKPQWGTFEKYEDGMWKQINVPKPGS